jgi:alpha-N-arabinofuranosidase
MRDAMLAATTLNTFNNHCDRVKMANLAQAINVLQAVILTEGNKMILTPTYHVMEMYAVHHDAVLLPIELNTEMYQLGAGSLPAISGSASKDAEGRIHLSLTNIEASKTQQVSIDLSGLPTNQISARILTSAKLQDHNTFENPALISPEPFTTYQISNGKLTVDIPAFSLVVLSLQQ